MVPVSIIDKYLYCPPNYNFSGLACWCVAIDPYGLRKLRPHVELQSSGQRESVGNGAETKRPTGHGYDTFVMSSPPTWKR